MGTEIIDELEKIKDMNDGYLDPHLVVDYARNPDSAMHKRFEWDDTEAAQQFRLEQARRLIRMELSVVPGTKIKTRSFLSLVVNRKKEGPRGYLPIETILKNKTLREEMLNDAFDEFEIFERKYKALEELADVFVSMEKAKKAKTRRSVTAIELGLESV